MDGRPPLQNSKQSDWRSWLWVIGLVLLFSYWMQWASGKGEFKQIPYTAFIHAVRSDRVASVTMKGQRITGRYSASSAADSHEKQSDDKKASDSGASQSPPGFKTVRPAVADPGLLPLLEKHHVTIRAEVAGNDWLDLLVAGVLPWLLIIGLMVYSVRKMQQRMGSGPGRLFGFGQSKAKRITREEVNVTYDDVAGLENTKKELREIILYLKSPQQFQQLGAELPKGVLLIGPPGVGKTLMARATAGEADVSFFSISGSEFIEMFVGVGASRVRDLFKQAKQSAPAIIFVDELDSIGRTRGAGVGGGHDEREQTLNQILSEMDGFSARETVVVMAATNRPDVLDPALTRPGRFDRHVTFELPRKKARLDILKIHTRHVPLADDVDLAHLADRTVGMSGADLKNLVNEAALLAARQHRKEATAATFEMARDKILIGIESEDVIGDKERTVVAYHEAGHALVAKLTPDTDPLEKVTIVPRGQSLGVTEQMPIEDRHNLSRTYLLGRVAVMLGGRVAERLMVGDISTGAGNDLKRATELVRRMVCEWGMSETLGPVTFGGTEPHPFLGRRLSESKEFSENTARLIDEAVHQILKAQELTAERLLEENRNHLEALAQALLDHEVVNNEEVERILHPEKSTAPN